LQSLPGLELRPTSDRLRETLFDILTPGNPDALAGSVWVDLFAGTGAVGLEALSRGAESVSFVETSSRAVELIRKNLQGLKIGTGFQVLKQDAVQAITYFRKSGLRADFVFLDPPYLMEEIYTRTLEAISAGDILKPQGMVIAEHQKKFDPGARVASLERHRLLVQGDAALSFYHLSR
jgi:16S rRNA (guanine(966)-N(2))-methyltransferase RsmD